MIVKIKALLSGQFKRSRDINDMVEADDVIGRIFHNAVFNNQITTRAGVITFLADDDQQVIANSIICTVDDEAGVPALAGMPAGASLSSLGVAAKKAAKKAPAKKKTAKRKAASKKKTATKKTAKKKNTGTKRKAAKKASRKAKPRSKKTAVKKKAASKKTGGKKGKKGSR